jgi:hypothetical protein
VKVYSKGARVAQPNYGPGTVTDADTNHTVIDFDNHGLKRFVTTMVALSPTSEPAPEKAKATRRKKAVKDPNAPKAVRKPRTTKAAKAAKTADA